MKDKNSKIIIFSLVLIIVLLIFLIFVIFAKGEFNRSDFSISNKKNDVSSVENSDDSNLYISKEEALKIALDNVGLKQKDIYDIGVELDYKYGKTVYEIDFNYQQYDYEFYIDAVNGDVVHSFKERDD